MLNNEVKDSKAHSRLTSDIAVLVTLFACGGKRVGENSLYARSGEGDERSDVGVSRIGV